MDSEPQTRTLRAWMSAPLAAHGAAVTRASEATIVNGISRHIHGFGPFCQRFGLPVYRKMDRIPFVASLFAFGRPSHIPFFVMSVVVFPFHRMFNSGATANFCQELFKRLESKLDATTAVVRKGSIVDVLTSVTSVGKRSVLRGRNAVDSLAVGAATSGYGLYIKASARTGMVLPQMQRGHFADLSAITFTPPECARASCCEPQNDQISKALPRQVEKSSNGWMLRKFNVIFGVGHDIFSCLENRLARLAKDSQGLWRAVFIVPNSMQICMTGMHTGGY